MSLLFLTLLRSFFFLLLLRPLRSTLFPYTTLFRSERWPVWQYRITCASRSGTAPSMHTRFRSEEHTSELQSRFDLVCRLLLEKKKDIMLPIDIYTLSITYACIKSAIHCFHFRLPEP